MTETVSVSKFRAKIDLVECCFTSTETVGLLGTEKAKQDNYDVDRLIVRQVGRPVRDRQTVDVGDFIYLRKVEEAHQVK